MDTINKYTIDLNKDLPAITLLVIILFSFLGGFYSSSIRPIYYSTCLISLFLVYFLLGYKTITNLKIRPWIFYIIYFSLVITSSLILFQSIVNTYHVYLLFVVGLYLLFSQYHFSRKSLIIITNVSYLIYLFFSILLYFGIISIGRDLNIFDIKYNLLGIKTFIGLFGSTASIDSYATVIILINLYFNESRSKWIIIVISAIAALLTFRSTPILVFLGPFIILYFIRFFKSRQILFHLIVGIIFIGSFLPYLIYELTESKNFIIVTNFLLTGRASLWIFMIEKYFSYPIAEMIIGFGDTINFEVFVWGRYTANPHNMYLKILIVYGLLLFILFYLWTSRQISKNTSHQLIVIFAILLAGIGNSNIFSFMNLPFSIWFIALLTSTRNSIKT